MDEFITSPRRLPPPPNAASTPPRRPHSPRRRRRATAAARGASLSPTPCAPVATERAYLDGNDDGRRMLDGELWRRGNFQHPTSVDSNSGAPSDLEISGVYARPLYGLHFYKRLVLTTACRKRFVQAVGIDHRL